MRRAIAILNRCAGGGGGALEELGERVAEALRMRGLHPEVRMVDPEELTSSLNAVERGGAELLVIGGGDGSIRCAAARAMELDIPLAVLPLGTMNLVAKDFGVPLTGAEAAEALTAGEIVRIDVGEVNGRLFLHSAVLGIVPSMGAERERARGERGVAAAFALARRMWGVISRERPLRASLEFGGQSRTVSTYMIAISANRLRGSAPAALLRDSLQAGELGIYWATHQTRAGLLQLLGELGAGLWGLDERVERHAAAEVTVRARRRRVLVSIDGEPELLELPLRFRVRAGALRVLTPQRVAEETAGADA
jgi:diacylglycerol kinase family enzyme